MDKKKQDREPYSDLISTAKREQILTDHKREGKRFIPPLAQFATTPISWGTTLLPELIWLGLLNDRFGLKRGADLALSLSRTVMEVVPQEPNARWPFTISAFVPPEIEHKLKLWERLSQKGQLEPLRAALLPLHAFYPECPLNYLYESKQANDRDAALLNKYKTVLASLFNRWERPATLVQGNALYICFLSGKLKFFNGSVLEQFPEIANFPNTEISVLVASAVRATLNAQFAIPLYKTSPWPEYFWNRGLQLEPCSFE